MGLIIAVPIAFLFIFILNILLYITVPFYKDALNGAVKADDIPVVEVSSAPVIYQDEATIDNSSKEEPEIVFYGVKSEEDTKTAEKLIVDKTYYEDCGTGKGYWVITYADGSTSIQ